ncbi:MAG: baseplate J/gp47 family protein, partial [Acidobacteriota bacterium]
VRKPGLWQIPAPDSDPDCQLYLFRTMDGQVCAAQPTAGGALCPVSTFPDLAIQPETPSPFYSAAESALELTLTAPSYAFGNLLYAPNVLNAVIDDLPAPPGSTSTTPPPVTASATDTRALRSAVDALSTLSKKASEKSSGWFGRSSPNKYRENLAAAVQEWQANLVAEVRTYLQRNLVPIAGAGTAQVRSLLATAPAGTSAADKARSLDAALQAASPALPAVTAGVTAIASLCLQAVPAVDQALQQCASQDGDDYQTCVEGSLAALQTQLDQALDSVADGPVKLQYPNPPWLPQARSVSVSYTASCSFQPSGTAQASFYYLLPFGAYQLPPDSADAAPLLSLPACPGELLLGLSSLEVPQTLNILFQMAPGGFRNPPAVMWEHLEENWIQFQDSDEPADTTNDLQQTGVVSLIIPAPSTTQQAVAPAERRWLRAVAASDNLASPDFFPETIGIFLNPVLADRVDGDPDDPSRPTPANTIRKPTQKLHGVGNIQQPSDSFGGRAQESEEQLQTRQAERLRHKDRAVLPWDYERLVLQAFPDIWKVRALPATGDKPGERSLSRRPGHVLVVVVAGPSTAAKDPTRPVATVQTLQQIHQFLKARASVFARIRVVNPHYVGILVTALVSFTPGEDPGASIDRLDSDLVQYLSPWFYDDLRAEKSGDYASQDAIIEFILSRSYIAALNKITFEYDGDFQEGWCFYTSAPKHRIRQDTSRKKAPL